jgi:Arc/MetJ-type ribon-helix-helix transcriptional regulator
MSQQITVRLPEELVRFVDDLVGEGVVSSRAEAVAIALKREWRRRTALADAEILRARVGDVDLDAMIAYTAEHPVDLGD